MFAPIQFYYNGEIQILNIYICKVNKERGIYWLSIDFTNSEAIDAAIDCSLPMFPKTKTDKNKKKSRVFFVVFYLFFRYTDTHLSYQERH